MRLCHLELHFQSYKYCFRPPSPVATHNVPPRRGGGEVRTLALHIMRRGLFDDLGNLAEQVVVLDAGSSGTRVHVFDFVWESGAGGGGGRLRGARGAPKLDRAKCKAQRLKVRPGLSSWESLDDMGLERAAAEAFAELVGFARKFVPARARAETPIILKATAGLRMVAPAQREKILGAVRLQLEGSGFWFRDDAWATAISGTEEAGLAWVAANYLGGAFDRRGVRETKGVVEMGGGSSQISFHVPGGGAAAQAATAVTAGYWFPGFFAGEPAFAVYAKSYLGFGRDHAFRRYSLTREALGGNNPCLHRSNKDGGATATPTSYAGCLQDVNRVLFNTSVKDQPPVIPGTSLDPDGPRNSIRGTFVGTEVFFYVRENIQPPEAEPFSLEPTAVAKLGRRVCENGEGQDAHGDFQPGEAPPDDACFTVAFQSALLEHLGATGVHRPEVVRDIGGVDVEWALGAAVRHLADENRLGGVGARGNGGGLVGESTAFLLAVVAGVLAMVVAVIRAVQNTPALRAWGRKAYRQSGRGRRGAAPRGRVGKRHDYKRVQVDDGDGDGIELAPGVCRRSKSGGSGSDVESGGDASQKKKKKKKKAHPVRIKWKMSDEALGGSGGGAGESSSGVLAL